MKTFVAKRDQLRVHDGQVHTGEAFPASDVTPSLLDLGWVREGRGTMPRDRGSHKAFSKGETAAHGPAAPTKKAPKGKQPEATVTLTEESEDTGAVLQNLKDAGRLKPLKPTVPKKAAKRKTP